MCQSWQIYFNCCVNVAKPVIVIRRWGAKGYFYSQPFHFTFKCELLIEFHRFSSDEEVFFSTKSLSSFLIIIDQSKSFHGFPNIKHESPIVFCSNYFCFVFKFGFTGIYWLFQHSTYHLLRNFSMKINFPNWMTFAEIAKSTCFIAKPFQ